MEVGKIIRGLSKTKKEQITLPVRLYSIKYLYIKRRSISTGEIVAPYFRFTQVGARGRSPLNGKQTVTGLHGVCVFVFTDE